MCKIPTGSEEPWRAQLTSTRRRFKELIFSSSMTFNDVATTWWQYPRVCVRARERVRVMPLTTRVQGKQTGAHTPLTGGHPLATFWFAVLKMWVGSMCATPCCSVSLQKVSSCCTHPLPNMHWFSPFHPKFWLRLTGKSAATNNYGCWRLVSFFFLRLVLIIGLITTCFFMSYLYCDIMI